MAKQVDRQALAMEYLQLLQSGVPAQEAFKQVYPNGIPTAAQQQQADAKSKQGAALAGTGGTIAGLLGIKYGMKGLESLGATGAGASVLPSGTSAGAGLAGSAVTDSGLAGLNALGASGSGSGIAAAAAPEATGLALPSASMATAGPIAAALGGTYLGGKAGLDMIQGKKPGLPGRVILGMATGGLSEVGNALLGRETTRDYAKKNTKSLLGASKDANYQNYISGMREQFNSAPTGPAFNGGQFENFEQYKKAGLNAQDLSGVYGNLKLGEQYTALPQEMKNAYTQSQIDKGNYKSKKGEVQFVDEKTAQADFANFVGGMKPAATKTQAVTRPVSDALAKKQLAQTGVFGNKLLEAMARK